MSGPQRHRLLQGFPALPLMRPAADGSLREWALGRRSDGALVRSKHVVEEPWVRLDPMRPVIVGIIPHTQCNPRVEGCGFCTFPHDRYDKALLRAVASATRSHIADLLLAEPSLAARRVEGVYFGGGTANLTPVSALRAIGEALARHFDLSHAEVTMEGAPHLFRSLLAGPLEALEEMPARSRRISMGIQTFDKTELARMGRAHFGDAAVVAKVVEKAHRRGMSASGDFLINLPGQPLSRMLDDVRAAAAVGLDQICIYHLVLRPDSGVPWSRDPALLSSMPSSQEACAHWLAVREELLNLGFVQTTLTNFERASIEARRRFAYEVCSFAPDRYDAIGFGPLSISTFVDWQQRRAIKLVRSKDLLQGGSLWRGADLMFRYEQDDTRLLFLTRSLAALAVSLPVYRSLFGSELRADFAAQLEPLVDAGLVVLSDEALSLTERGMFYADSVAGLLAWQRAQALRHDAAGLRTVDLLGSRARVDFMG